VEKVHTSCERGNPFFSSLKRNGTNDTNAPTKTIDAEKYCNLLYLSELIIIRFHSILVKSILFRFERFYEYLSLRKMMERAIVIGIVA
jgi:hypothetical protein